MTVMRAMKVSLFVVATSLAACPESPTGDPMPGGSMPDPVDDATPDDPYDPYLIDLNNGWLFNEDESRHSLTLVVTPYDKVAAAIINGSEILAGSPVYPWLDGTRENFRIHLTSTLGARVVTYDGVLGSDGRMHLLVSPGGAHAFLH